MEVPAEILALGKRQAARWYWEQLYGEYFDSYSDTAYRNFIRVCLTLVERVVKNWSNRVYADGATGTIRFVQDLQDGPTAFDGTAVEMMSYLEGLSYADSTRITRVGLQASSSEPEDREEIRKINALMQKQLEVFRRAQHFDLYRRLQDAYNGNVENIVDRDRDMNFMGVIRPDAEHVESILPHLDGHYLLVKSTVIIVDGKARAHPPPMAATALHFAVMSDKVSCVKHLVSKGANGRTLLAACGATAHTLAIANKCKKALAVLDPESPHLQWSPSTSPEKLAGRGASPRASPTAGSPRGSPAVGNRSPGAQVYSRDLSRRR
jgi:hypothetical protein